MRRLVAVFAALLAVPASAHADSIVFRRDGDVWRMAPDGTMQQRVTSGGSFEWPSAADDGTLVAADAAGQLHRWSPAGVERSVIPTARTVDDEEAPTETPSRVRVSPDGTKVAYDQAIDGDLVALWTTTDATAPVLLGQDGYVAPSWIGNDRLALSRDVSYDAEDLGFALQTLGGDAVPWFTDTGAPWASGLTAVASRSGERVAVLAEDAAEADGVPTRVALRLFAGSVFRCELALEAGDGYVSASPTFSPDGSRLAWAERDGIHVTASDCSGERVVTLPGAWEPYWTPYTAPVRSTTPRLTLGLKVRSRPWKSSVRKRGVGARVTVSAPATVRLSVGRRTVRRTFGHAGTYTVRVRVKVRKRIVVRVSADGAEPVVAVVRPR